MVFFSAGAAARRYDAAGHHCYAQLRMVDGIVSPSKSPRPSVPESEQEDAGFEIFFQ